MITAAGAQRNLPGRSRGSGPEVFEASRVVQGPGVGGMSCGAQDLELEAFELGGG